MSEQQESIFSEICQRAEALGRPSGAAYLTAQDGFDAIDDRLALIEIIKAMRQELQK